MIKADIKNGKKRPKSLALSALLGEVASSFSASTISPSVV
ncbi:hypothetical protein ACZ87_02646 [Candidatus Erwinia dacicola]|uniref:Uncharacterized protein n=1 Tax=Candidatus Erwinia dacicola TaxID=252393 RepID=A0A328TM92_9GAMM|nr:hypothetical protein ACZ87_02646 [Candidatus Erwinia dacicola]